MNRISHSCDVKSVRFGQIKKRIGWTDAQGNGPVPDAGTPTMAKATPKKKQKTELAPSRGLVGSGPITSNKVTEPRAKKPRAELRKEPLAAAREDHAINGDENDRGSANGEYGNCKINGDAADMLEPPIEMIVEDSYKDGVEDLHLAAEEEPNGDAEGHEPDLEPQQEVADEDDDYKS
ncbi:MAG: hypothetical protein M1832_001268 [Thelocarpon impressellum]|nr:MAG: hypothetical protein M1832_001268 [Thelocarpon impressellum]